MPLITYPDTLPPPSGYPFARREGRALPQGAGNEVPRPRMRDAIVDADAVRWRYSPDEMAVWRAWFADTLLNGQLWFTATLPGRGGWLPRVARYIGEQLQLTHLGAGNWEVSCRLELRGLSAAPGVPVPPSFVWDEATAVGFSVGEEGVLAGEGSSASAIVYSAAAFGTGKHYVEIALDYDTANTDLTLGLIASDYGTDAFGVRDVAGTGVVNAGSNDFFIGGGSGVNDLITGDLPSFIGAARVCIAVDLAAREMWLYPDGTPAGSADPATGDAPTFSGWAVGRQWLLFALADNDGTSHILRLYGTSSSAYLFGPPAGFTPGGA